MALVELPDLQRETKYSIVKNRIVKAVTPELADVLVHTNGHAASETNRGEKGASAELELGDGGLRKSSAQARSTPASQSSPRPQSAQSALSSASGKEDEQPGVEDSERLSITSATEEEPGEATDQDDDDDDVVVTRPSSAKSARSSQSRPASAKSAASLAAATYSPEENKGPPSLKSPRPVSAKSNQSRPTSSKSLRPASANVSKEVEVEAAGSAKSSRPVSAKSKSSAVASRPVSAASIGSSRRESDALLGSQHSLRSDLANGVSRESLEEAGEESKEIVEDRVTAEEEIQGEAPTGLESNNQTDKLLKEAAEEISTELEKVQPKDLVQEIPDKTVQELPKESVQELPKELVQELPKESVQELPKGLVQELPKESVQELLHGFLW